MFPLGQEHGIKISPKATSEVRFFYPVYRLLPMARKGGGLWRDQLRWKRIRKPTIALDLVYTSGLADMRYPA